MLVRQIEGPAGVVDRRPDLPFVANNPFVGEELFHFGIPITGDLLRVETIERVAEVVPLSEDGQPRKPGLKALEADLLEEKSVFCGGLTPFGVVVGAVDLGLGSPPASGHPVVSNHDLHHEKAGITSFANSSRLLRS
jgi:hypothetical protein